MSGRAYGNHYHFFEASHTVAPFSFLSTFSSHRSLPQQGSGSLFCLSTYFFVSLERSLDAVLHYLYGTVVSPDMTSHASDDITIRGRLAFLEHSFLCCNSFSAEILKVKRFGSFF